MRWPRRRLPGPNLAWVAVLALVLVCLGGPARTAMAARPAQQDGDPIPLLAYYYIWFDPGSWDRAKSDLPLLGRYSSDDPEVMRQHVGWAKQVGIDGFIVSWKRTEQLNPRLEQLVDIAEAEDFKLAVIYQGLDFERRPQPVDRIADDLEYFLDAYAGRGPFNLFEHPVVIWSGTWEFTGDEIASVTAQFDDQLLILASERQVADYEELAALVDGNAYYWSSVDPDRTPGYQQKLDALGQTVHARGGIWLAPAAPGFDARLIEGTRVIERDDGKTLLRELSAAHASAPDAVALISWNEFSENTHVEPSRNYGMRYLELLAEYRGGQVPEPITFESDEPASIDLGLNLGRLAGLAFLGVLILGSLAIIARRGLVVRRGG